MTNKKRLDSIKNAEEKYVQAAKKLCAVTLAALPLGTILMSTIGRARPTFEVVGHSDCWWSSPGYIIVQNVKTRKTRRISALSYGSETEIIYVPADPVETKGAAE